MGTLFKTTPEEKNRFLQEWKERTLAQRARLSPLARAGDPQAQFDLGLEFDFNQPRDRRRAFKWYRRAAEQGHAEAQNYVGEILRETWPRRRSAIKEAADWFRQAAAHGQKDAQVNYGVALFYGRGVPKNQHAALKWYRKAARQGCSEAYYNLGLMYRWGGGVPRDRRTADGWFRKAIAVKHNKAYEALYFLWLGAPAKPQTACRWLEKGCFAGDIRCLCHLGDRYRKGDGVPKSMRRAYGCYRKASVRGSAWACYWVGRCHRDGIGVPKNMHEARRWMKKASSLGVIEATKALQRLR